jgi:hypothetical protein
LTHPGRLPVRPARTHRRPTLLLALALGCTVGAAGAAAQAEPRACPEGAISALFVDNHSVFDLNDPDLHGRFGWAYRLANRLHVPTREQVIRREILFGEGDCYDVALLRDSERMIRSLGFIASVDIFGVRQPDGSVHVIVDTQDEWSTRVEARVGSGGAMGLKGLRLREDNLLGTGQHVSLFYRSDEEVQVYGAAYHTPQLLGTRWDAGVQAGRTPVGHLLSQSITYPFVGEVGRWGFRQAIKHHDRNFEYLIREGGDLVAIWVPERRQSFDVGGAVRWGGRGYNRTLAGVALAGEWVSYPAAPRYARDAADAGEAPVVPFIPTDSVSSVRLMLLAGQRNVVFARRRALDTVNGVEDVRLGVEAEFALGPSIRGLSTDRDLAIDIGFFAGAEPREGVLAGVNLLMEARRNYDKPPDRSEWADVFGQLNAWAYWRPAPGSRHLFVGSLAGAGGWHEGVPFQLTLGEDAGLRGFPRHLYPGGRRLVASVEHRANLGWPLPRLFDLGSVAFVDAGRIWAGDAPFGIDSPVRVNVGAGIRAAFPPGSRQTFRLDVGVPAHSGVGRDDVIFTLGVGQAIGLRSLRRDPQLGRSSRQGVSTSIFLFPPSL